MELVQPTCQLCATRCDVASRELIPLFHRWIQSARLPDHLLIDVTDYSHVVEGPGVLLVTHQAFVGLDTAHGRLEYRTRRGPDGPAEAQWRRALAATLRACALLQEDLPGKIEFDLSELVLGCDDRLRAPNTPESFAALEPALRAVAERLHGGGASLEPVADPRRCFRARIRGPALGLAAARERLGA